VQAVGTGYVVAQVNEGGPGCALHYQGLHQSYIVVGEAQIGGERDYAHSDGCRGVSLLRSKLLMALRGSKQ
jgi:hypothetical protein